MCYSCISGTSAWFSTTMHPVNPFHCFQETFEFVPPDAPFPWTATAGVVPWLHWASKTPRLQDLEALRQNGCDHYGVASQKPENFNVKKGIHHSVQAKATASSINFKVYQLYSWAWHLPNNERRKQRSAYQPFTSFHSAPTVASHHRTHAFHRIQSPSSRPVHWGARRPHKAGILSIEVVQLKAICGHHFLSEHENQRISNSFDSDDGDGIQTFSKKIRIVMKHLSHPVPPHLSVSSLQSRNTEKLCLLNLINLDNLEVQLGIFLKIGASWR